MKEHLFIFYLYAIAHHSMTELQRLIAAYDGQVKTGSPCALATVVQVEGSAYRRPGARMLITADGQLTGTISGGCLEGDARRRAQQVMMKGRPEIVVYDSLDLEDDLEFGAQLGCQGKIHVLIEPVTAGSSSNVFTLLRDAALQTEPVILSTVLNGDNLVGARVLVAAHNKIKGSTGNASLDQMIIRESQLLLKNGQSATTLYDIDGDEVVVFSELIKPAPRLTVYGAGNDVQPLVRMAYNLGWRVNVIDGRPNLVIASRFPEAEQVQCIRAEDLATSAPAGGYAVLMSHNYFYDLASLRHLLNCPEVNYIGLLGPRKKTDRLLGDLQAEGLSTRQLLHRLYGPVGLDIGAEAAEEIAVAIMAELIAVRNNHAAGFLKDLDGPIHTNPPKLQQHA